MAKSIFGKMLNSAAKAAEKAMKAAEKDRQRKAKLAEKERLRKQKEAEKKANNPKIIKSGISKPKSKEEADAINRSFRKADSNRYKSLDFVLGFEIKRSNNKNTNCEICKVGEGKYPKDFNWSGWHNGCKCHTISVLQDEDAFIDNLVNNSTCIDYPIKSVPESLNIYVQKNKSIISNEDWYKNNKKYF